jgi:hypothetical protein
MRFVGRESVDLRTQYALAVLLGSVGRDLSRSLPPKEKPAKELPYAWRLALVRVAYALLCRGEAESLESLFTSNLTRLRKDTETSETRAKTEHKDQKFV